MFFELLYWQTTIVNYFSLNYIDVLVVVAYLVGLLIEFEQDAGYIDVNITVWTENSVGLLILFVKEVEKVPTASTLCFGVSALSTSVVNLSK